LVGGAIFCAEKRFGHRLIVRVSIWEFGCRSGKRGKGSGVIEMEAGRGKRSFKMGRMEGNFRFEVMRDY
jgi:hypothetical protein